MDKIIISNMDLQVSKINFGGNVFGWTLNEAQSFEMLDALLGGGVNFIDTADAYSWWLGLPGISETIIGKWMKVRGNRDQIVLATKVGSQTSVKSVPNVSKAYILKTLDESLQRLQTDYIDLYYTHFDDGTTPVEETLSAYHEAIKAGKIRYIAASNITPERLQASFEASQKNGLPEYVALQPHYNLIERSGYETTYAPLVEKYGLTVFPYYALASGFLTGKYRSKKDLGKSVRGGGAETYLNEKGLAILDALDAVSEKHDTTPATISLAWLLHKKNIGAPIVSATNLSQLQTILSAPSLMLDNEDLNKLEEVSK